MLECRQGSLHPVANWHLHGEVELAARLVFFLVLCNTRPPCQIRSGMPAEIPLSELHWGLPYKLGLRTRKHLKILLHLRHTLPPPPPPTSGP